MIVFSFKSTVWTEISCCSIASQTRGPEVYLEPCQTSLKNFFFENSQRLKPWGHGAAFSCTCNATFLHCTRLIMLSWSHMQTFCVQIYFIFAFLSLKSLFLFKILILKALTLLHLDKDENRETSSRKAQKHWVRTWLGNRQLFGWSCSLFQEVKRVRKLLKSL